MAEETKALTQTNGDQTLTKSTDTGNVAKEGGAEEDAADIEESMLNIEVVLPHAPRKTNVLVAPHDQIHEIRQAIMELPQALQYSCFHLEHKGQPINDFSQISDIENIGPESKLRLVEDPYTEKDARIHLIRVRELIGAAGDRTSSNLGTESGSSIYEKVTAETNALDPKEALKPFDFTAQPILESLLPAELGPSPKTVKAIGLSPWNPPPAYLRQKGHLLYLTVTTNEGEQHQITSHVSGFYLNKSSNTKFDPTPRAAPKGQFAHSLLTLIQEISPSFDGVFAQLQEYNGQREPLATYQITNSIPAAPWITSAVASSASLAHVSDPTRTQESYLINGAENTDSLRDWNEEFQSAKELPKDNMQDRVFRERLVSKLHADYIDAATKGAVLVARGEVSPLNPTEATDAQIFVYNNVFFSFGADGVGTFTSEGGDEAARVATGKDVAGVRFVNSLDIDGLHTPGTVVIDYLGRRIVGQSIVPGIFKQREPEENSIDYGAVDGKDVVADDERFTVPFAALAKATKVKKHAVWDKNGKRFDLEGSVETKGLVGTDARKYILDLYRLTPLDVAWLEHKDEDEDKKYPHRMTVLRAELVELYKRHKARAWLDEQLKNKKEAGKALEQQLTNGHTDEDEKKETEEERSVSNGDDVDPEQKKPEEKAIDARDFKFALNPDVCSGQVPQTDEEKAEMEADEAEVRAAGTYLTESAIPGLLHDLKESDISFPMDGTSLRVLLHKRGINLRYMGKIAKLCAEDGRLQCLRVVCTREMIARSFKHILSKHLKPLPLPLAAACVSHLLNCLLGADFNPKPTADIESGLRSLYHDIGLEFEQITPASMKSLVELETSRRFRFALPADWATELGHLQLLREISLKLGLQFQIKDYHFTTSQVASTISTSTSTPTATQAPTTNGVHVNGGESKSKKKKKARDGSPSSIASASSAPTVPHTFTPDDIVNIVPIVKDSAPRSVLAEEALEAGRISIAQDQLKLGQELLLESLSLHEQIFGIIHPEVARCYHSLSLSYLQLDEKEAAVELARKAIIVSERTMGIDSQETLLNYLNLGLFLHQSGDSGSALEYVKHALRLWRIIYGPDHPDTITTINNAAVMLQHLKAYRESRRWFEEALRICESVFGHQSVNSATLLFQLAQALALDQDSKAAVKRMRESYNIFLAELGAQDKNTKEAETWLEQLTQNAVSIAKHAKDVHARRAIRMPLRVVGAGGAGAGGAATLAAAGAASARAAAANGTTGSSSAAGAAAATGTSGANGTGLAAREVDTKTRIDERDLDELVKYIQGTDKNKGGKKTGSSSSSSKGGPKKAPAGRRGGSISGSIAAKATQ